MGDKQMIDTNRFEWRCTLRVDRATGLHFAVLEARAKEGSRRPWRIHALGDLASDPVEALRALVNHDRLAA